ncbi:N-acetylglucosamine kinase [Thermoactinospora rubra]|uniref:N-acetylglucosamine kinase n=1 Tax=Thermoactinospora rubra TaxID=1088767 RepID=UPI000A0F9B9C|nr:BadF/BadG/BcrA/BcrD ATPase family protein [Thermoactinospora rubra]
MTLVLGVDAGGTSSRAVVATLSGEVAGRGRAGPGNPAVDPRQAAANLGRAVREALTSVNPREVKAASVGLAGLTAATEELWRDFPVPPRVVGDVAVAFAAGTARPSGTVLISGTGAIAAKIIDHEVTRTADGHGWQLGDEGSAFWIGRRAARAVVRGARGPLAELVLRHLGVRTPEEVPAAVQARPPLALAELAPLVSAAVPDPVAVEIAEEAAARLARTLAEVHVPGTPVVLAGSVLTREGPVRRAVLDLLAEHRPGTAGDGAGAAAWLAARELLPPAEAAARHARFTRECGWTSES